MAVTIKQKLRKTANRAKKKTAELYSRLNTTRLPFTDDIAKAAVKLCISAAAVLAVCAFVLSGAELSPSAIARGYKDKRVLSNAVGEGYPVQITGSHAVSAEAMPYGTAVLTDSVYTVLDFQGREVSSQAHYMASPVMDTVGRYSLLFDRGNTSYQLKTLSGNICSGRTEDSIICGTLSRSGSFGLVTNCDTAYSRVYVFAKSGKALQIFKSNIYHISDIAISPSGSLLAMCGVTTENGILKSAVIIRRIGSNHTLREYTFDKTLIFAVEFTGDGSLMAVGDDMAARLAVHEDKKTVSSYADRTLLGYDISPNGCLALVLSQHSDGRNAGIRVVKPSGEATDVLSTALTSPYVELTNNRLNLIGQSHFYSYSLSGKLIKEADIPGDSQSIVTSGGHLIIKGITSVSEIQ